MRNIAAYSRRDFLRLSGLAASASLISGFGLPLGAVPTGRRNMNVLSGYPAAVSAGSFVSRVRSSGI